MLVHAEAVRLAQIVTNLLNNASKFTESGGRIALAVERWHEHALIRVADNGIGIPRDKLESIFEIFVQVDPSIERSRSGLGLGLTLVKSLAELHGGSVEVHSEGPGKGNAAVRAAAARHGRPRAAGFSRRSGGHVRTAPGTRHRRQRRQRGFARGAAQDARAQGEGDL